MNILLGVSGGIAAYKACAFVSLARKAEHQVKVLMTHNATRFVGALSFEALSGHPATVGQDHMRPGAALEHIELAKWADVAVIAPLTANVLAKLACGIADDALTTVLMALPRGVPVVLGPAMNTEMWLHPVTQRNRGWLDELGRYQWVEPESKRLACGDVGPGGLAEPATLLAAAERAVGTPPPQG